MRLDDLQRSFQARIIAGTPGIEPLIADTERIDVSTRLGIYEHAYTARIVTALGETYRATRTVIGAGEFDTLAAAFLAATPSTHASIRDYGGEFGRFIAGRIPGVRGEALGELADWEWLLADVCDARDADILSAVRLSTLTPGQWADIRFVAHPTLRRCRTRTNAVELWRAATGAGPEVTPARRAPIEWVAWRCEFKSLFRSLMADEAAAIDLMRAGESFAKICERVAETGSVETAAARAAMLLRTWLEEGLLADLRPG